MYAGNVGEFNSYVQIRTEKVQFSYTIVNLIDCVFHVGREKVKTPAIICILTYVSQLHTIQTTYNLPVTANVVNEVPITTGKKTRRNISSPHIPPLPGKFGATGRVRLHSDMPSPSTQNFLSQLPGSRPGSGSSNRPSSRGSRPGSRPGTQGSRPTSRGSRPTSRGTAREPTIPSIETRFSIDPNRTLQEVVAERSGRRESGGRI